MTYTITKIEVFNCAEQDMGAETTEQDAAGYCEWLTAQLLSRFRSADVEVYARQNSRNVEVEFEGDDQFCTEPSEEVEMFLSECWDRCPWNWA